MITYTTGNILEAETEALVNTVNCVGIMGKGIALQFKQAHPDNYAQYVRACEAGEVQPGRMLITQTGSILPPHYIINFPTKRHWRGKSRLEDIDAGLEALKQDIRRLGIRSIAIPPLGCGSGGLAWSDVRPRIEQASGISGGCPDRCVRAARCASAESHDHRCQGHSAYARARHVAPPVRHVLRAGLLVIASGGTEARLSAASGR